MAEKNEPDVKVVDRRWWARGETAAADDAPARKPTVIEDLEQQLAETAARLQAVLLDQRRSQQEFDDLRAPVRREAARDAERTRRTLLADLLEVVDNLDRALAAASVNGATAQSDAFLQLARGVALVRDQFLGKLEQFGVTRLASLGEPFDALRHEAVSTAAVTDPALEGTIVTVVKEGYVIGDELLRPASVVVGRVAEA